MPPTLPDHVDATTEALRKIADRHGFGETSVERLPETGVFNAIYRVGDGAILRVPRNHPKFVEAARNEAVAVPAARSAGVRTRRPLAFDDSLEVLRFFLEPLDERWCVLGPVEPFRMSTDVSTVSAGGSYA